MPADSVISRQSENFVVDVAGPHPMIAHADVMDIAAGLGRVQFKRMAGNRHDTTMVTVGKVEVHWMRVFVEQVHGFAPHACCNGKNRPFSK
jgi:hypothetical protein